MQAAGLRVTNPPGYFHAERNREEIERRIYEQEMLAYDREAKQDALEQRQLDAVLELQHQDYLSKVRQKVAQIKEEKRRVGTLENSIILGDTAPTYRIGDINVSGLTMLQRVDTLEKLCNFLDGTGNLDLSTRLTNLETWLAEGGVWDETCSRLYAELHWLEAGPLDGGKDELPDPELHEAKVSLHRWTFRIRAIEDRLNMPRHQLLSSAWIYGQLLQRSTALEGVCGLPTGKGKLGLSARLTVLEVHLNNNRFPRLLPRPAFLEDDPGSLFEDDPEAPGFKRRRLGVVFFHLWHTRYKSYPPPGLCSLIWSAAADGRRPESKPLWLMLSILLVAVLTFLWSWLGPTHDYVFMFMTLSGTVFVGGLVWGGGDL
jgi:hypothetical protein